MTQGTEETLSRKVMILPSGGTCRVLTSDGDRTTIESPESSPPGSVVRARVDGLSVEFQLKVRNCRKQDEGFAIDGRTQNATREMRAWLKC